MIWRVHFQNASCVKFNILSCWCRLIAFWQCCRIKPDFMLITAKMDMMCFRNESSYVTHHIELSINATFILFVGFGPKVQIVAVRHYCDLKMSPVLVCVEPMYNRVYIDLTEGLDTWRAQDYVYSSKTPEHFNRPRGIAILEKAFCVEKFSRVSHVTCT
jgi:hypothetical protein